MKPMTNAEVAAYFATLPPDKPAGIIVANLDTASAQEEELVAFSEVKDEIDDGFIEDGNDNVPTAWQKW